MAAKLKRVRPPTLTPYTPDDWNPSQAAMHEATDLDIALNQACSLAGGWYRRPVRIDMQVTADNNERYRLRPAEIPPGAAWRPCYVLASCDPDCLGWDRERIQP